MDNGAGRHGDHYWDYFHGALSLSEVNAVQDGGPVDEIYMSPVFKGVAETWQGKEGTKIIVVEMATRWYNVLFGPFRDQYSSMFYAGCNLHLYLFFMLDCEIFLYVHN